MSVNGISSNLVVFQNRPHSRVDLEMNNHFLIVRFLMQEKMRNSNFPHLHFNSTLAKKKMSRKMKVDDSKMKIHK